MIDLRSDTITLPTPAMRAKMAGAPVGDDVLNEDPTVRRLQERAAELLGTEAALFVPSGTMANQLAILVHTRRGDDVLVGHGSHSYLYESGGGGTIAGIQFSPIGADGLFSADDVCAAVNPDDHHYAPTSLIMAENSHNRSGGRIFPIEQLVEIRAAADRLGLMLHIDGARLLNAAIASDTDPQRYGAVAHSVSLCLSKGLGAPVGSVIAGSKEVIHQAHRWRKMLGGGMRQAGIIAAGGLYALEHHVDRLAEDNRRARAFASGVADCRGVQIDLSRVQTNIVLLQVTDPDRDAEDLRRAVGERGVLLSTFDQRTARAVFHMHIGDADVPVAIEAVRQSLELT